MTPNPLTAEIAKLRRQLEFVEEENRWLKEQLAPPGFLPNSFKLTPNEGKILKAFISRKHWTREALLNSIYLDSTDDDLPDIRIIDVFVCKIRRKLKRFGVEISTHWGDGFSMTSDMQEHVKRVIAEESAKEA